MGAVRKPAVAGAFYPDQPDQLVGQLHAFLNGVPPWTGPAPKALIVPHAGYVYSGPVAASAYARLLPARGTIRRVVLLGPSHKVAYRGIAASTDEAYQTPLGVIPVDRQLLQAALQSPGCGILDAAHAQEHSLEVHLPFLQVLLGEFSLLPLVVGEATAEQVAMVLDSVWGGPETLIVISTDLSHYLPYEQAQKLDATTCAAIEAMTPGAIGHEQACGRVPMGGLLYLAKKRGMSIERVDVRNSGDTAGPKDRVVGYGAWALSGGDGPEAAIRAQRPLLLQIARDNIARQLSAGSPAPLPAGLPPLLQAPGAAFVTLKKNGNLRGCIGSPVAWRPLGEDIADNAIKAAIRDPRFPPLTEPELDGLELSISILTPPEPMSFRDEADLLAQLRPHLDGLIIEDGNHRALFLPSVWESLPIKTEFLGHLKQKAGLAVTHWSPHFKASRFAAVELK